jgi:hypothetical protein
VTPTAKICALVLTALAFPAAASTIEDDVRPIVEAASNCRWEVVEGRIPSGSTSVSDEDRASIGEQVLAQCGEYDRALAVYVAEGEENPEEVIRAATREFVTLTLAITDALISTILLHNASKAEPNASNQ